MYKITALICCRGGSKGIPGKNIKMLAGKPMLAWVLEESMKSQLFDEIILSTDSEEIAAVGREYGANVPGLRPSHLAQDDSNVYDTHKYTFDKLEIQDETHRVCILTNNPFINAKILAEGYEISKQNNYEGVVLDCVPVGGDYLFFRQCFEMKGRLWFHFPKMFQESQINRQTIAPTFTSINNTRWGKPSLFEDYEVYKDEILRNGFLPVPLPKLRNFDIDDPGDWEVAEAVFENVILPGLA